MDYPHTLLTLAGTPQGGGAYLVFDGGLDDAVRFIAVMRGMVPSLVEATLAGAIAGPVEFSGWFEQIAAQTFTLEPARIYAEQVWQCALAAKQRGLPFEAACTAVFDAFPALATQGPALKTRPGARGRDWDSEALWHAIDTKARQSYQAHIRRVRGTTITRFDSVDSHVIAAAIEWADTHPLDECNCAEPPQELELEDLPLTEGDRRVVAALAAAVGHGHPVMTDMLALLFAARNKE